MAYSLRPLGPVSTLALVIVFFAAVKLIQFVIKRQRSRFHLEILRGPPSPSFLFGRLREFVSPTVDISSLFDRWVKEYGPVFKMPSSLGSNCVMICDPKAIAHVYANDSFGYLRANHTKIISETLMGRSMITVDKEDHRRLRRAAAPAFTNNALRGTTSHFFDTAHKVKAVWDTFFESRDEVNIEVHEWLGKITLDSIGIAGFGHDFKSIEGHKSAVNEALDSLSDNGNTPLRRIFFMGILFPPILKLPLKQTRVFRSMKKAFSSMAMELLQNAQAEEKDAPENVKDRSILGLLVKGRTSDTNFKLLHEEVVGQIGLFLTAGHDTISSSLSWALLELARNPDKQEKLRQELFSLSSGDPTWDQLTIGTTLPYLDAVVHEILRLHPPVEGLHRVADKDDSIPLSSPMTTPSGEVIDSVFIPKGTMVNTPFAYINRSEEFWGPDAKKFIPERWLEENPYPSKDFSGYRHIYSFSDGPRMCMGRMFALAEMKAVLTVFIRHFTFDLPCGPETPVDFYKSFMIRPKLADERDCVLKMRVRQVTTQ